MCAVRPRFSWITRTAPRGVGAAASTPIRAPCLPAKRISSPATSPAAVVGVDAGADTGGELAADVGVAVVGVADDGVADDGVAGDVAADEVAGELASSLPQDASSACAAGTVRPSS